MEFFRSLSSGNSRSPSSSSSLCPTGSNSSAAEGVNEALLVKVQLTLSALIPQLVEGVATVPVHLRQLLCEVQEFLSELYQTSDHLLDSVEDTEGLNLSIELPERDAIPSPSAVASSFKVRRSFSIPKPAKNPLSQTSPRGIVLSYVNMFLSSLDDLLLAMQPSILRLQSAPKLDDEAEQKVISQVYRYQTQLSTLQQEVRIFLPNVKEAVVNWRFKCAKPEVESWWSSHFHDNFMVTWQDFMSCFVAHFKLDNTYLTQELQQSINFANTNYVSKFSVDLFTRLFPPWSKLVQVWRAIVLEHPAYFGMANYEEARDRLQPYLNRPGSYIFRYSATKIGLWSIAYVKRDKTVAHVLLRDMTLVEALTLGAKQKIYMYPYGRLHNPDLQHLLEPSTRIFTSHLYGELPLAQSQTTLAEPPTNSGQSETTVTGVSPRAVDEWLGTNAQVQQSSQGTSQSQALPEELTCKICFENRKNTQLEPCLHFMCAPCFSKWMSRGENCPFCREPIRSFRRVVLVTEENLSVSMGPVTLEGVTEDTSGESAASSIPCSPSPHPGRVPANVQPSSHRGVALPPLPLPVSPREENGRNLPIGGDVPPPLPPRHTTLLQ